MTGLSTSHILGLSIFSSYFLIILFLFHTIISSITRHAHSSAHRQLAALVFGALALASFIHTWFWMFRFMAWSFYAYEGVHDTRLVVRVAGWLADTGLFEQAWSAVCTGPLNWWWSEQLCLFTAGAFTVFLYLQRERVPHVWAYMLLGQLVAISVAWSLLNLALVLIPPKTNTNTKKALPLLPPSLTIPVLLSMLTISLSPYTSTTTFLPNLLSMHALLMLPFLLPFPLTSIPLHSISPRASSFYTLLALLSLLLRTRTTLAVFSALQITTSPFFSRHYPKDVAVALWTSPVKVYTRAWEVLHAHPAQASIGWDVVWTSVAWLAWCVLADGVGPAPLWGVKQAIQVAFGSVGVVAPLEFGRVLVEGDGVSATGPTVKNE